MPASRQRSSSVSSTGTSETRLPRLEAAIAKRQAFTDQKMRRFTSALVGDLGSDRRIVVGSHTCVYAVGSAGRGELTPGSDLDLFLVRDGGDLSNLDAVLLQAAILRGSRQTRFPDPSGDGEWLRLHATDDFIGLLGSRKDDSENTFTARMLLLLESRPILGKQAYGRVIDRVLDAYWRNYEQNRSDYQPIVLINDIVRYWRIVLLNYEAKNTDKKGTGKPTRAQREVREAERRLRSYKLRFSRCLTCYSALTYLLALTRGSSQPNVTRRHVRNMVALSPLQRLIHVRRRSRSPQAAALVDDLLEAYLRFLEIADLGKNVLVRKFRQKRFRQLRSQEGKEFGEKMFELVCLIGKDSALYRWIVV